MMRVVYLKSQGFSLIELIVFIVVISIALAALIQVFNESSKSNVDPLVQIRALECAQAKMDEVLSRKFDEATPSGGVPACGSFEGSSCSGIATVVDTSLNDVGDYDLAPTDTSKPNCSITVDVTEAGGDLGIVANQARRITVIANTTSQSNTQAILTAYKVNF